MNNQDAPRSIQHDISIQQVGTETLVYDERRHKAFCLNEISSVLWRLADGEHTIAQISAVASLQLKAPVSEELVLFTMDELRRDGLIEPSSNDEAAPAISRRDLLQRLGVGSAMLIPVIAAIVAPTAAQAYSGCFDCDASQAAIQSARTTQLARARRRQLSSSSAFTNIPGTSDASMFSSDASSGPISRSLSCLTSSHERNRMRLPFYISRENHRRPYAMAAALSLAVVLMFLSGCGESNSQPTIQRGFALQGYVRGGQQPVSGASIALYAAGSIGPGAGATNLLAPNIVTTDAFGAFGITGEYVCPTATTQVYLVARGGNPGLAAGGNNPALVMMAALGNCGDLSPSTNIAMNEVTTVASVWTLAQFMGAGGVIGSTATNATGLQNAFAVAKNLVDTSTGLTPGSALPNGAVTESAKLYTLADVLAACVNSDGGAACAPLFSAATTSAGAPTNTLDAALNIVRNPAANVLAVFNAFAPRAPFQPVLSTQPNDWTMSITYGACASGCGGLNLPGSLAIDSGGNVLVANYFGATFSKFSPTGVPASATGFPGIGLEQSYGIAVDGADNVWVTNEQSVTAANNHHLGSVQ